jgi:AAA domain-containing protein
MANIAPNPQSSPQKRKALASVKKGVLDSPQRVLIYGAEKIGKSSFAAGAPDPIFIGAEDGTERLDVERLQPSSWVEVIDWIGELAVDKHDYKTLVIDPVNWLEPMCWEHVCQLADWKNIEEPGYGKGYTAALEQWRIFTHALERCRARGMHIILVAHSHVKTFQNPEGPSYDRYEVAMNPKAAGHFKQWVADVLFARIETYAKAEKKGERARGFTTDHHIICTKPSAAYDAGTRWTLPEEIDLSWADFVNAITAGKELADKIAENITTMLAELGDATVTKNTMTWLEKNKTKSDRLTECANRLGKKLEEKKSNKETKS